MERCEGMARAGGQGLPGLNAGGGGGGRYLWTVGEAMEGDSLSEGVSEQSLWLLYRLTGTGLEAGKPRRGCDQAMGRFWQSLNSCQL